MLVFAYRISYPMSDASSIVHDITPRSGDSIVLPAEAVEGLSAPQLDIMKSTVAAVQTNLAIAGAALRSTCYELHTLKGVIPNRSWTKFINSGALPFSAKAAQDMCNSWLWLKDTGLTDGDLINLSTRALNKIANASPEAQVKATKVLKAGGTLTVSQATALSKEGSESDLKAETKAKVKKNLTAVQKLEGMESEIEKLKKQVEKLKKENAALSASRNLQIETVMKSVRKDLREGLKIGELV